MESGGDVYQVVQFMGGRPSGLEEGRSRAPDLTTVFDLCMLGRLVRMGGGVLA
jgi:hypothetical protein